MDDIFNLDADDLCRRAEISRLAAISFERAMAHWVAGVGDIPDYGVIAAEAERVADDFRAVINQVWEPDTQREIAQYLITFRRR